MLFFIFNETKVINFRGKFNLLMVILGTHVLTAPWSQQHHGAKIPSPDQH